jgi:hypothetical protein
MLHIKLDGSDVTITRAKMAAYGRPPTWSAEFDHWASIEAIEFSEWPTSDFTNIKKTAARLLRTAERENSVD